MPKHLATTLVALMLAVSSGVAQDCSTLEAGFDGTLESGGFFSLELTDSTPNGVVVLLIDGAAFVVGQADASGSYSFATLVLPAVLAALPSPTVAFQVVVPGGGGGCVSNVVELTFESELDVACSGSLLVVQEALPANVSGIARHGAVATFGLSLAEKWKIPEVDGRPKMWICGSDLYQLRTLARWPDGSVRWALVDMRVDLEPGEVKSGLSMVSGGAGISGQPFIADTNGSLITLDTGPMQASVLTSGFNIVDRVVVDGTELVAPGTSPGIVAWGAAGQALSVAPGANVWIEENGPARAVVRVDGSLETATGADVLDFTCRLTARADSTALEVTFTVRNANLQRPQHTVVEGIELWIQVQPGSAPAGRLARHDGVQLVTLGPGKSAHLFQAYSEAPTLGVTGEGPGYKPHIPKLPNDLPADQGYRIVCDGEAVFSTGNTSLFPPYGYVDLSGSAGGVTAAIRQMPYFWPAALELTGDGLVGAGVFTRRNAWPYTFVWRQHESRSVVFSFRSGPPSAAAGAAALAAREFAYPVAGRYASYRHYKNTDGVPYDLLNLNQQNHAYIFMGLGHTVTVHNSDVDVTRFLAAHQTGGANNYASIETALVGEWLRHGHGGQYLEGLDLALYKSEWQILRSDGFHDAADPGPINEQIPHSDAFPGDAEHRYREGIVLAYHLTGDERFRDALLDEAEILSSINLSPQERSMYQTLRALAVVADFTGDASLLDVLRQRIAYVSEPTINVHTADSGWGWEAAPDQGLRRYFANSTQNSSEKPPGENFQARGFISASLGPLGFWHASRVLGDAESAAQLARGRMRDLAYWTKAELFPFQPDPADRRTVYSYAIGLQQYTSMQSSVSHPFLMGMAEAFLDTGDVSYLNKGLEQIEAFKAVDQLEGYDDNMYDIDTRLDCQHFLSIYLAYKLAGGE